MQVAFSNTGKVIMQHKLHNTLQRTFPVGQRWSSLISHSGLAGCSRGDRKINTCIEMGPALRQSAGVHISRNTISHPAIKQCVPRMYCRGGVHLTDERNNVFLESLHRSLLRCSKTRAAVPTPHSLSIATQQCCYKGIIHSKPEMFNYLHC